MVLLGSVGAPAFAIAPLPTTDTNIVKVSSQLEIIEIKNNNLDPGPSLSDVVKEFSSDVQLTLGSATKCDCTSFELVANRLKSLETKRMGNIITFESVLKWTGIVTCQTQEEGTGCSAPLSAFSETSVSSNVTPIFDAKTKKFVGWRDPSPPFPNIVEVNQIPNVPPPGNTKDDQSVSYKKPKQKQFQITAECKGDCDGKPDKNNFETKYKVNILVTPKNDPMGNLVTNPHPMGVTIILTLFNFPADCGLNADKGVEIFFVTEPTGKILPKNIGFRVFSP